MNIKEIQAMSRADLIRCLGQLKSSPLAHLPTQSRQIAIMSEVLSVKKVPAVEAGTGFTNYGAMDGRILEYNQRKDDFERGYKAMQKLMAPLSVNERVKFVDSRPDIRRVSSRVDPTSRGMLQCLLDNFPYVLPEYRKHQKRMRKIK